VTVELVLNGRFNIFRSLGNSVYPVHPSNFAAVSLVLLMCRLI
jgi:hypothetical protein